MVVGTASSVANGRNIKSPPADIFVWGLHPETTPEDIVKDLADSNIIIQPKDIIKKSKEGSALLSFKVSVRAEDLQLALDPSIWPLRVKVREYIYYPKKKTDSSDGNSSSVESAQQTNPSVPNITINPPVSNEHVVASVEPSISSMNRFSALAEVSI